ncbi:MAG: 3'(2'),5'-bisphosphate nucleotidase [Verrucomicrobia bacterium]|nr:MAG: 3'(2'),5'-bisphosphate nucleotidase [Verrucomicrobiota bacterium]
MDLSPTIVIETLRALAAEAGRRIMTFYAGEVAVTHKDDQSPLTAADQASHAYLVAGLRERFPSLPVLSEEGRSIPFEERRAWRRFFLVDPLDGTKEFLRRNGEFTVNIALVEEGAPWLGVVHLPAAGTTYWGGAGLGAWRRVGDAAAEPIRCRQAPQGGPWRVVASRSHPSPELEHLLKRIKVEELVPAGSSLKFCRVAEGEADLYPRFGPTMEWDTAAGQAVLEGAGGVVIDERGCPLRYNKECLRNPRFLAAGFRWEGPWAAFPATD